MLMACLDRKPRRKATSGHDRNSFSYQSEHSPAIERLMEVTSLVKLAADVALFEVLVERAERVSCEIILDQRVENRLCGEHPRFDRGVNTFQPLAVEHARGVADDHNAVRCQLRHRVPSADRHGLCPVADQLAAFEQIAYQGMRLEALKLVMRINARIAIVEADRKSYVDDSIAHAVDPRSAKGVRIKRPAHRVNHRARRESIVGHFPKFFDADGIDLWIAVAV